MPPSFKTTLASALIALIPGSLLAADPLPAADLGVLQDHEVQIVQDLLWEKAGTVEVGLHTGLLPADAFTVGLSAGLSAAYHLSEGLAVEVAAHGIRSSASQEAETLAEFSNIQVDSFSPTAIVQANLQWSPIYAKLNLMGQAVVHYDIYFSGGAGAFLAERTLVAGAETADGETPIPDRNNAASINFGTGQRFFFDMVGRSGVLRLEARDHLYRVDNPDGSAWTKHNLHLTCGVGVLF